MPNIAYQELEIEISRCLCGEGEVRLLDSRLSRPRERFSPTYDTEELNRRLERLDELILEGADHHEERRRLAQSIGRDLHAALLPGRVKATFDAALNAMRAANEHGPRRGMRVRLGFGEPDRFVPEVVGLPWELICSPDTQVFPARSAETPMVRFLDLERSPETLVVEPPLRVLALLTTPRDLRAIDRNRHWEQLKSAAVPGRVEFRFPRDATLAGMEEALKEGGREGRPVHGLHFLGHGAFDEHGEGFLNFEDGSGQRQRVPGDVLAEILSQYEVRWATLASCSTARMMRRHGQHPFAGAATALLARGLSAVIGMQFPVSEAAAGLFAHGFYRGLASGNALEEAVTEGRRTMLIDDANTLEWASPVLFLRSRDGRILDLREEGESGRRDDGSREHGEEIRRGQLAVAGGSWMRDHNETRENFGQVGGGPTDMRYYDRGRNRDWDRDRD